MEARGRAGSRGRRSWIGNIEDDQAGRSVGQIRSVPGHVRRVEACARRHAGLSARPPLAGDPPSPDDSWGAAVGEVDDLVDVTVVPRGHGGAVDVATAVVEVA